MYFLRDSDAWPQWTLFAFYVARKLRRLKESDLADQVKSAAMDLQQKGRTWEELTIGVQEANADKDAVDDDLDAIAMDVRANLAGRSATAEREMPYLGVFPNKITWYTRAAVADRVARYQELGRRLKDNLPADDPVVLKAVPALEAAIAEYQTAVQAINDATYVKSTGKQQVDSARQTLRQVLESILGKLTDKYGRKKAERVFPTAKSKKSAPGTETVATDK